MVHNEGTYLHFSQPKPREDLLRRFLDGILDERARFHVDYVKEPYDVDNAVYEVVNFIDTKKNKTKTNHFERATGQETNPCYQESV